MASVAAPSPKLDRYIVIHVATTCDEHGVYVTKDSAEVIELGWILLDTKTCEEVSFYKTTQAGSGCCDGRRIFLLLSLGVSVPLAFLALLFLLSLEYRRDPLNCFELIAAMESGLVADYGFF